MIEGGNPFASDKYLTTDFQGWPVNKMTVREMLEGLGFTKKTNMGVDYWEIPDDDPVLDVCPRVLHDDGMGYGVDEEWVTECDAFECNDKTLVNIFVEKKDSK